MSPILNVREIELRDIELVLNYWFNSSEAYMASLGADSTKLPPREDFKKMLEVQIDAPIEEKQSYALIWEVDGQAVGHSNVNDINFGVSAKMHLHLWYPLSRKKGMGSTLVKMSLPYFFEQLQLEDLFSEPYALNPAPNKTLEKVGFEFQKKYQTIPGSISFEQEVNSWKLSKSRYHKLYS